METNVCLDFPEDANSSDVNSDAQSVNETVKTEVENVNQGLPDGQSESNPKSVEQGTPLSESENNGFIKTVPVNATFNVRDRLAQLTDWNDDFIQKDLAFSTRQKSLNPKSHVDAQIGASISHMRKCLRILLARNPLEIVLDEMGADQLLTLRESLFRQFASLTASERMLWLNNFEFILTPALKRLYQKLARIRDYRSLGQQRCLLIGGPSGMGKTTCLNVLTMMWEPEITDEVTLVRIVKVDAPANNRSSRTLFRRIINALGLSYLVSDSEDELFDTALAFLDACQVELIVIDEIEHMTRHEHRRQVLDLSNQTRGISIICASCNPASWTEGDAEIAGRWNDLFLLEPYDLDQLAALLSYIEILLPFSQPSNLNSISIRTPDNQFEEGPAGFIYRVTQGILRDVMILVRDGCKYAIENHLPCIDKEVLQIVWKRIQESPNPRNEEKEID